jgi:uncharacterized protein (DUF2249 family)
MITKDIKISKLLKDYPDSLDVLLRASPHFSKLQNKLLRKALAGRVTVEQAASIAGVNLEGLLNDLNELCASTQPRADPPLAERASGKVKKVINNLRDGGPKESKPEFLKSISSNKMILLDVRPIIDSGKDPLKDILSIIKKLKKGEILLIINSFEPIPLYSLLTKKGFSHWTEREDDYFKVYFYKEKEVDEKEFLPYDSSKEITENDFKNVIEIDVHELQPPEPMIKILENLYRIDEESVMVVYHHREPLLFYPKLEERGYQVFCQKISEEKYKILIAKKKGH